MKEDRTNYPGLFLERQKPSLLSIVQVSLWTGAERAGPASFLQ